MTILQDILAAVGWQTRVNENNRSLAPAALYGIDPATTTGLTLGYLGGEFNSTTVANGTVTLTASATNYIVANLTTGAVTAATNTTNWNNTATYMRLYQLVATGSTFTIASTSDKRQAYAAGGGGGGSVSWGGIGGTLSDQTDLYAALTQVMAIACSDETTALTAGGAKVTFRMPYAMTNISVRASLTTAQTSGSIFTVDINESGTSILSTKLTIDNTEKTSTTAATPVVVSDSNLADDAEITIDIDQIGDGTAKGLKVYLIGVKA